MITLQFDLLYMTAALEQARLAAAKGEVPVGAVAVTGDGIIARAHNRIELNRDAAAHAEMLVLREACRVLDRWRLIDVTLFVTVEPCPMCAMALVLHRVARVVFGASEPRTGAAGSFTNLLTNPAMNHAVDVTAGVCREEASELMKIFFRNRREADSRF
ncbi:nucleoside deaminase [bacterium]|nr:nucleoside deaminase [candidate division CSSED10-310 bacterium]